MAASPAFRRLAKTNIADAPAMEISAFIPGRAPARDLPNLSGERFSLCNHRVSVKPGIAALPAPATFCTARSRLPPVAAGSRGFFHRNRFPET